MSEGRGGGVFPPPRKALATLALSLAVAGCYTYEEISPAAAPPGSHVRVRVDPSVRLSVGALPLPERDRVVRGQLMEGTSADTLLCAVTLRDGDPVSPSPSLRGTVHVPVAGVDRLELRRLDKVRTGAAVGVAAALGLAVLDWAFNITNPPERPGPEPGGVNNARVVLFRLWR